MELWMLYKPNGYVLSVFGNGTFSHQRASEVAKRLQPINVADDEFDRA